MKKRLIKTIENTYKIYWDAEFQEYSIKVYKDFVYFTDDKKDALDTAKLMHNISEKKA
jgi:hypothetical protein